MKNGRRLKLSVELVDNLLDKRAQELVRKKMVALQRLTFRRPVLVDNPVPSHINSLEDFTCWLAGDFKRFIEYALRNQGLYPGRIQYIIADYLQGTFNPKVLKVPGYKRLHYEKGDGERIKQLIGMRGISKSTMVQYYVPWRWIRVPDTRVMLLSGIEKYAIRMSEMIKSHLMTLPPLYYLAPKTKVTSLQFDLDGASVEQVKSLTSISIGSTTVSTRTDVIIADDVETDVNTDNPNKKQDVIDKLEQIWSIAHPIGRLLRKLWGKNAREVLNVPTPEQVQLLILGTYQHDDSIYILPPERDEQGHPVAHPFRGTQVLRIPAIDDFGESIFPERLETTELQYRRDRMSPRTWRLQYDVSTEPGEDELQALVKFPLIKLVEANVPSPIMVLDPAEGGDDEWGVVIGGRSQDNSKAHVIYMTGYKGDVGGPDGYLFDGDKPDPNVIAHMSGVRATMHDQSQGTPPGVLDTVIRLISEYGIRLVYVERNRKVIKNLITRTIRNRKCQCGIREFQARMDKTRRVVETVPVALNSQILTLSPSVVGPSPNGQQNKRQLQKIEYTRLPEPNDRIDALSSFVEIMCPDIAQKNPAFSSGTGGIKVIPSLSIANV